MTLGDDSWCEVPTDSGSFFLRLAPDRSGTSSEKLTTPNDSDDISQRIESDKATIGFAE